VPRCNGCPLGRYRFTTVTTKLTLGVRYDAMEIPEAGSTAAESQNPYAITEQLQDELAVLDALDGDVTPEPWLSSSIGAGVVASFSFVGVSVVLLAAGRALRRNGFALKRVKIKAIEGVPNIVPGLTRISSPAMGKQRSESPSASGAAISPITSPSPSPALLRAPSPLVSATPRVDGEEIVLPLGHSLHTTV